MGKLLVVTGSKSDFPFLLPLETLLKESSVEYSVETISCHRNLKELPKFLEEKASNYQVIIAVANAVSNLPAVIAGYLKDSKTIIIGVGLADKGLGGIDSLLAVNTIPKGVPLVNTGIGEVGLHNAGLVAINILKNS